MAAASLKRKYRIRQKAWFSEQAETMYIWADSHYRAICGCGSGRDLKAVVTDVETREKRMYRTVLRGTRYYWMSMPLPKV